MNKSLLLSLDNLAILDKLTDEEAGKLIKALYQYSKDQTLPELDNILDITITPFINQIKQSKIKIASISEKRKTAGALGGHKKHANATQQQPEQIIEIIEPQESIIIKKQLQQEKQNTAIDKMLNKFYPKQKIIETPVEVFSSKKETEPDENLRMFNEIAAYVEENKIDSWWGIDLFEDDMYPAIRAVMMYDYVFKNKKNAHWKDYLQIKLPDSVINGINSFVACYRTKKELYEYCLGLHSEEFWRNKSLRDVFTFNKQTVTERYERAINNLNKLPASANI